MCENILNKKRKHTHDNGVYYTELVRAGVGYNINYSGDCTNCGDYSSTLLSQHAGEKISPRCHKCWSDMSND